MNTVIDFSNKDIDSLKNITKSIEKKNNLNIDMNNSNIDISYEINLLLTLTKKVEIKFLRKVNKISFRLALLAILEERVIETKISNRDMHNYNIINLEAENRYTLSNRNKKRFPTLNDIHPEDPFIKFENSKHRMRKYNDAILKVLLGHYWILDNKKAYQTLSEISNEIKEAYEF